MELRVEHKDQSDMTPDFGGIMMTPMIDEDYWLYRVRLSETQAINAFPKFNTIGIGFAVETDWNTNLPYTCLTDEIFNHIAHNKGDDSISDEDCLKAIEMLKKAIKQGQAQQEYDAALARIERKKRDGD